MEASQLRPNVVRDKTSTSMKYQSKYVLLLAEKGICKLSYHLFMSVAQLVMNVVLSVKHKKRRGSANDTYVLVGEYSRDSLELQYLLSLPSHVPSGKHHLLIPEVLSQELTLSTAIPFPHLIGRRNCTSEFQLVWLLMALSRRKSPASSGVKSTTWKWKQGQVVGLPYVVGRQLR